MATLVWVVIAIVVVAAIALAAVGARKRRTAMLRDRFGPEYDRAVESRDGRRAAEADLRARQKQRAQFDIQPLPEADRRRFAGEWRDVQERFVDQPAQATAAADTLITRVMDARGYPMQDFDAQADLVSVDHPDTVENYRFAHAARQRSQTAQVGTEDLREALLRYRSLFDDLLRPADGGPAGNGAADGGAADGAGEGSVAAGPGPRASLLEDGELQHITAHWKDIQAEFVDEPGQAVQEADALVAELMQRLAAMFAAERADLEQRWAGGHQVSTEDLRQGLRRYRSFFERLLAA